LSERITYLTPFLVGLEEFFHQQRIEASLALSPSKLAQNPYLYHERLRLIPQLPAPNSILKPTEEPSTENYLAVENGATYPTIWGSITFDTIWEKTYRYAYSILYRDLDFPSSDIEDGLQTGYLKLWQRLQQQPDFLNERPIAWIGVVIRNGAWHVLQKEQRRATKMVDIDNSRSRFGVDSEFMATRTTSAPYHSHESRQADKRLDIHASIAATAQHILSQPEGKERDRSLWALYCMTMLHVQVTEASKLFQIRHQAMKKAYDDVQSQLQHHLQLYAPLESTKNIHAKGQKKLPFQDISRIRQANQTIGFERYQNLRQHLFEQQPDTLERDLLALEGIEKNIPARHQARAYGVPDSAMQRAYERIHFLLAAQIDSRITPKRPEKKKQESYVFTQDDAPLIAALANTLLVEEKCDVKLVALYAYLCNIPTRGIAQSFGMNEATLRRYRHHVQERFHTISNH
jgi:hypothetical protein